MNINHLRYFQSVCKHQNITKASEDIHISQPSVTAAIKELEREFGFQLFYRINNRITLTPKGKVFCNMTNRFLTDVEDFYTEALDLGKNRITYLNLGIPTVLGTFFLKKIIPDFPLVYPNIHLKIFEVPTLIGMKMIEEAKLDLFIGIKDDTICSKCNSALIYETNLMFSASSANSLAKEKSISKEMLINQPFVIISEGSYHYKTITNLYDELPLNIVLQSNQLSTISHMVKNNHAVTIIYEEIFKNNPDISTIPLDNTITAPIGIFWKKNTYVSDTKKSFIRFMRNNIS